MYVSKYLCLSQQNLLEIGRLFVSMILTFDESFYYNVCYFIVYIIYVFIYISNITVLSTAFTMSCHMHCSSHLCG